MKTKSTLRNFLALAGSSLLAVSSTHADVVRIDFGRSTSAVQSGFFGQANSSTEVYSTDAGDISVQVGGNGFVRTVSPEYVDYDLLHDHVYVNQSGTVSLKIDGAGIAASTEYDIRFYAYESNNGTTGGSTTFTGVSGTSGSTVVSWSSSGDDSPGFALKNSSLATFTSDSEGVLNIDFSGGGSGVGSTVTRLSGMEITVVPEPSSTFRLTITPNASTSGNYDFHWDSRDGFLYDLVSSTDLATNQLDWPVWDGRADIAGTAPENQLTDVPGGGEARRFFAVIEKEAPPPPPLLSEDFEEDDGGFTVATVAGTDWEHGAPDSTGLGGTVDGGNDGSTNAWATNLGAVSSAGDPPTADESGFYADPTHTALRSPIIDLTGVDGAELSFAEALDFPDTDTAVVNLIHATTDDVIAQVHASEDGDINTSGWRVVGPLDLAAGVGQEVRIEWRFEGAGGATNDFMGWYIDDVTVTQTAP